MDVDTWAVCWWPAGDTPNSEIPTGESDPDTCLANGETFYQAMQGLPKLLETLLLARKRGLVGISCGKEIRVRIEVL